MKLNTLSPAAGSKQSCKRVGRGIGSGLGKTSTRGHKGQKSRAGGFKINFEGGQMPIQRRLPKFGFNSRIARTVDQVRLSQLQPYMSDIIDLAFLKSVGLVKHSIRSVKIIHSGNIDTALKIKGLRITKGARIALEQAGGHIEE